MRFRTRSQNRQREGSSGIGQGKWRTRFVAEGGFRRSSSDAMAQPKAEGRRQGSRFDPESRAIVRVVRHFPCPATGEAAVKASARSLPSAVLGRPGSITPASSGRSHSSRSPRMNTIVSLNIILKGKFFIAQGGAAKAMKAWRAAGGAIVQTGSNVGPAGDRPPRPLVRLFGGQWWRPCAGQEPRDRASPPNKIRVNAIAPRRDRDPGLQHIPDAGAGEDRFCRPLMQCILLAETVSPQDAAEGASVPCLGSGEFSSPGSSLPVDGGIMAGRQ